MLTGRSGCCNRCCQQFVSPFICTLAPLSERQEPRNLNDQADPSRAQVGEPIVGVETEIWSPETGPAARSARPLPSPKAPTPAAVARHRLTHLPYCGWCPICLATKRPNSHHRRASDIGRMIPFLVADFAYGRNSGDDQLACVLVVRVYPLGIYWACTVDQKGRHDPRVVRRLAQLF